ncbi:unnamed protein product [Owenia fusiformis]|uniref:Protein rolling stone n=1 Tax=Owenia fusiformis TaxID=6347 RepID=A0A8S4NNP4_OWEFU|nr:unnamed protein product [Owenia fusiformis]
MYELADSDESGDEAIYQGLHRPRRHMEERREGCCHFTAEELDADNFALSHSNPNLFIRSQWPIPQLWYCVYRVVVGVGFIVWVAMDIYTEANEFYVGHPEVWFIYATNWSFMLLGISNMYNAILVVYYYCKTKKDGKDDCGLELGSDNMPWSIMIHWMLYNIVSNAALVVTISFWTFLVSFDDGEVLMTPMSRVKHTLNTVFVLIDIMIQAVPIRLFHVVYPLFIAAVYIVFNALYFLNNGMGYEGKHYAYNTMDWTYPFTAAITCAMGLVGATLIQCVLFLLYKLRRWIYRNYNVDHCNDLLNIDGDNSERQRILGNEHNTRNYSANANGDSDIEMQSQPIEGQNNDSNDTNVPLPTVEQSKFILNSSSNTNTQNQ